MIRGMLLRLTDNATLSVAQTLSTLRAGLEQGGLCWIPILGQPPASGRHEAYPLLLVAADKVIRLVLEIHELRRGRAAGRDLDATADEADIAPAFADVSADAWLKVGIAQELTALEARFEEDPPLGQGINYVEFDELRHVWRRASSSSIAVPKTAPVPPTRASATTSGFPLPRQLRIDRPLRVLGIDLTANATKASAACVLTADGREPVRWSAPARPLLTDDDIVRLATTEPWDCIALDGPRAEPSGWLGFLARDEPYRAGPRSRSCERAVHARIGSIFFFGPRARAGVREWLSRSTSLFKRLAPLGDRLIEVFPHATFVSLVNGTASRRPNPIRPKDTAGGLIDREAILTALVGRISLANLSQGNAERHDILDAAAAAATAICHVLGRTAALGDSADGGQIIVPDRCAVEAEA